MTLLSAISTLREDLPVKQTVAPFTYASSSTCGSSSRACEMANAADLRQRVGNQIFQAIVVGEQKNNWRFHAPSFTDKRIRASQQLRIAARFLSADFNYGLFLKAL
jgi:hypothetical protein